MVSAGSHDKITKSTLSELDNEHFSRPFVLCLKPLCQNETDDNISKQLNLYFCKKFIIKK